MIQRTQRLRLALEPLEPFSIAGKVFGKYLDRDTPSEPGIPRAIDFPHSTGA
jgi:hypothetical protein